MELCIHKSCINGATVYYGPGEVSFTVQAQAGDGLAGLETLAFGAATYPQHGAMYATQSHTYTFDGNDALGDAQVVATDRAGNEATAMFTAIRDAGAPQASITAQVQGDYVVVNWSASDPGSGLDTCTSARGWGQMDQAF
jgi:hypothetical protein